VGDRIASRRVARHLGSRPAPSPRAARSTRTSTRSRRAMSRTHSRSWPSCRRARSRSSTRLRSTTTSSRVTRHEDIEAIFLDHEAFSAAAQFPLGALSKEAGELLLGGGHCPPPSMVSLDPPEHTRVRRHTARAFTPRRVASMEGTIRATVSDLLDAVDPAEPFDLVATLTFPLPATIVFTLIGVPPEDYAQLKRWCGYRAGLSALGACRRPSRGDPGRGGGDAALRSVGLRLAARDDPAHDRRRRRPAHRCRQARAWVHKARVFRNTSAPGERGGPAHTSHGCLIPTTPRGARREVSRNARALRRDSAPGAARARGAGPPTPPPFLDAQ
jgi:cytochrome P450